MGQKGQKDYALDLTMVSSPLMDNGYDWKVHDDSLSSDHFPITLELFSHRPVMSDRDVEPRFNYKKADWDAFGIEIHKHLNNTDYNSIPDDRLLETAYKALLDSAKESIPFGPPKDKFFSSYPWWTEDCDLQASNKQRAGRHYRNNPTTENKQALFEAVSRFHETRLQAEQNHWTAFLLEEIQSPADLAKLWQKMGDSKKSWRGPAKPILLPSGAKTTSAKEKAEAFVDTFSKVSQSQHDTPELKAHKARLEATFNDPPDKPHEEYNVPFSLSELKTAIAETSSAGKATGRDPISNTILRHLPEAFLPIILRVFNHIWQSGTIPQEWKIAQIVPIPKADKPPNLTSSYRPIALTSHLGKLLERVVKNRLSYLLEKNGLLPNCQAGFRRGRHCQEHILHIIQNVKDAWYINASTVATFFDIRRAFDTVWHAKLLQKIADMGIGGNLYRYVKDFLTNRFIAVKVDGVESSETRIDMGVPQGSVIAPLLFSIMLSDLVEEVQKHIEGEGKSHAGLTLSLFADDLAIWHNCMIKRGPGANFNKLYQTFIDAVAKYMSANAFTLSPEKTTLVVFSKNKERERYKLKLGNVKLIPKKSVKFLGVILQDDLLWNQHRLQLITKARKGVNVIRRLSGATHVTPRALVHVTQALVRSRLMYGHIVYHTQEKTHWEAMERVELAALKVALGVNRAADSRLVYQEANILPFKLHCRAQAAAVDAAFKEGDNIVKYQLQFGESSDGTMHRASLQQQKPRIYNKSSRFESYVKPVWDRVGACPDISIRPPILLPPWDKLAPKFLYKYMGTTKKSENSLLMGVKAQEQLELFPSHTKVYTDGSKTNTGVGFGCAIPSHDLFVSCKINSETSIFTAELSAIQVALDEISKLTLPVKKVLIVTDSLSSVKALERGGTINRQRLQLDILRRCHRLISAGYQLEFLWVPSHTNIRGNDMADRAAKVGTTLSDDQINDLGLTRKEWKSLAFGQARQLWTNNLARHCARKGLPFHDRSQASVDLLPRAYQRQIRKIKLGRHRCITFPRECACGVEASLSHALDGCEKLPHTRIVADLCRQHQIEIPDLLKVHPTQGTLLLRTLAEAVLKDSISDWF
jgi:ribonuclease HI